MNGLKTRKSTSIKNIFASPRGNKTFSFTSQSFSTTTSTSNSCSSIDDIYSGTTLNGDTTLGQSIAKKRLEHQLLQNEPDLESITITTTLTGNTIDECSSIHDLTITMTLDECTSESISDFENDRKISNVRQNRALSMEWKILNKMDIPKKTISKEWKNPDTATIPTYQIINPNRKNKYNKSLSNKFKKICNRFKIKKIEK